MDRISALPDHILSLILSRLSVKESARTSALSKRWFPLWLLSPIRISDRSLLESSPISFEDREVRADFLIRTYTHILTIHPGPITTCNFTDPCWNWKGHHEILTRLLGTLTLKGIQELAIGFFDSYNFVRLFTIPDCVLRCESLLDLELGAVVVPNHLSERIFPNLRSLKMWSTDISNHALYDLLKSSSSIVELVLGDCLTGPHYTLIESESLKSLSVGGYGITGKLIIKDAPSLEYLLIYDDFTRFHELEIINVPKLETLYRVDMKIAMLRLGESQFACTTKPIKYRCFNTRIESLQKLGIKVNFYCVYHGKTIPYFLRCFPCLEALDVLIMAERSDDDYDPSFSHNYGNFWKQQFDIDCFNSSLEVVELKGYSGQHTHSDFAKFIISYARVLKVMTIFYEHRKGENWVKAQRQRLCLENRASPLAQVVFVKRRGSY